MVLSLYKKTAPHAVNLKNIIIYNQKSALYFKKQRSKEYKYCVIFKI